MRLRTSGFTLVEVLVALAIVAIGMAALLGALSSAADGTTYLRDKSFAEWIALNHVAETRLRTRPPDKGRTTGEVEFAGRKWQWQQVVEPMEIEGVSRIDVSVRPADAPAARGKESGGWTASVSGVFGAALAPPSGAEPDWDGEGDGAAHQNPPGPRPDEPSTPTSPFEPDPEAPAT